MPIYYIVYGDVVERSYVRDGQSYTYIATEFHIGYYTVQVIAENVADTIYSTLKDEYLLRLNLGTWIKSS